MSNHDFTDSHVQARRTLAFIQDHWPRVAAVWSSELHLFERPRLAGGCTDPKALKKTWLASLGCEHFHDDPTVADDFQAVGVHNGGGNEYLFAMWSRGGRRFWFYDSFVNFHGAKNVSVEATAAHFDAAMNLWERSDDWVGFSGPWGWYQPGDGFGELSPWQELLYVMNGTRRR